MNGDRWNTATLDGSVPEDELPKMPCGSRVPVARSLRKAVGERVPVVFGDGSPDPGDGRSEPWATDGKEPGDGAR